MFFSKKNTLAFLTLLIATVSVDAQVIFQGTIKDVTTNEPLIGAFITVKGAAGAIGVAELDGSFQLLVPAPSQAKNMIISASHLGFLEEKIAVEILPIDDGETITQNFALEPDPLSLQEIKVTANRVEEELQDVPVAITVINALELRKQNVATTDEAFQSVPNLVTDAFLPSQSTFSLRGLASDFISSPGIENSVGFYIDDVFYSRSFHFNQTLMDIERVEVLRGPQGTLFGKNSIGGVLHVISEDPKMSNFGAVELNAGNFQYLQARAKVNTMLVPDKLAMRVSGTYRQRSGWLIDENPETTDLNKTLFYGGRVGLAYEPSERLSILLKGTFARDDKAEFTVDNKPLASGFNPLGIPAEEADYSDRRVHTSMDDPKFNRSVYAGVGKVKYSVGRNHTITSITAVNGTDGEFSRDFDASSIDGVLIESTGLKIDAFSQEIRLSTPRENRKLFYVFGLYYLNENIESTPGFSLGNDFLPFFATSLMRPEWLKITDYSESAEVFSIIKSRSYAGFFSTSYEVSENIRLNAGLRYTNEEKTIDFWQIANPYFPGLPLLAINQGSKDDPIKNKVTDAALSWQFGIDLKTTDRTLLYLNVARGFKGSGFNVLVSRTTDASQITTSYKPEFINSYEVGIKLRSSNRFQFNAAAFVTDYQDKQEANIFGSQTFIANAKAVQGQGIEAEFIGIWNNFFKTEASLGALNLEYTDFPFIDNITGDTINLSGNRAFKAPAFTFKFAPEFHTIVGKDLKLLVRADYNYVGKVYNDIRNTESVARKGAGILNGRVAFSTRDERYSIALWGKNLVDNTYIQHAWLANWGSQVAVNPPRTIGVELRVNFYKQ